MHGHVVSAERLTPSMIRVVLGGGDLDLLEMVDATDAYVNLAFAPASGEYDGCFDPAQVAAARPKEQWPARRRYTVRRWDVVRRALTIDFVVHGSEGVAGAWAASAAPGDCLVLEGPAGGYRPSASAGWHLMVGDESALPAIAASLESLPAGSVAVVRLSRSTRSGATTSPPRRAERRQAAGRRRRAPLRSRVHSGARGRGHGGAATTLASTLRTRRRRRHGDGGWRGSGPWPCGPGQTRTRMVTFGDRRPGDVASAPRSCGCPAMMSA